VTRRARTAFPRSVIGSEEVLHAPGARVQVARVRGPRLPARFGALPADRGPLPPRPGQESRAHYRSISAL
jgi:hypothetical protein